MNEFSTTMSKNQESQRRTLCETTDTKPSIHHQFNASYSKKYVKGKDVLDIGCWTGQFDSLIFPFAKSVTGIDPNKKAIAFAKRMTPKAAFFVSEAQKLPFKNKSFDTVTIMDVIEHVPVNTEGQVLSEIYRVLRPGGHLVLSTPNRHVISILFDPAFFLIGHRHYSVGQLKKLLADNNLKVKSAQLVGNIWELLMHNVELVIKHTVGTTVYKPKWLVQKIKEGYSNKGFAEVYLVAQKTN